MYLQQLIKYIEFFVESTIDQCALMVNGYNLQSMSIIDAVLACCTCVHIVRDCIHTCSYTDVKKYRGGEIFNCVSMNCARVMHFPSAIHLLCT